MFCKNCGREIDANAVVCPHCGVQVKPVNSGEDNNIIAIVGFVFSFLIALVGLICSIIGYKKAVNEGAQHKSLALAGIIISAASMVITAILVIIYVATVLSLVAALA